MSNNRNQFGYYSNLGEDLKKYHGVNRGLAIYFYDKYFKPNFDGNDKRYITYGTMVRRLIRTDIQIVSGKMAKELYITRVGDRCMGIIDDFAKFNKIYPDDGPKTPESAVSVASPCLEELEDRRFGTRLPLRNIPSTRNNVINDTRRDYKARVKSRMEKKVLETLLDLAESKKKKQSGYPTITLRDLREKIPKYIRQASGGKRLEDALKILDDYGLIKKIDFYVSSEFVQYGIVNEDQVEQVRDILNTWNRHRDGTTNNKTRTGYYDDKISGEEKENSGRRTIRRRKNNRRTWRNRNRSIVPPPPPRNKKPKKSQRKGKKIAKTKKKRRKRAKEIYYDEDDEEEEEEEEEPEEPSEEEEEEEEEKELFVDPQSPQNTFRSSSSEPSSSKTPLLPPPISNNNNNNEFIPSPPPASQLRQNRVLPPIRILSTDIISSQETLNKLQNHRHPRPPIIQQLQPPPPPPPSTTTTTTTTSSQNEDRLTGYKRHKPCGKLSMHIDDDDEDVVFLKKVDQDEQRKQDEEDYEPARKKRKLDDDNPEPKRKKRKKRSLYDEDEDEETDAEEEEEKCIEKKKKKKMMKKLRSKEYEVNMGEARYLDTRSSQSATTTTTTHRPFQFLLELVLDHVEDEMEYNIVLSFYCFQELVPEHIRIERTENVEPTQLRLFGTIERSRAPPTNSELFGHLYQLFCFRRIRISFTNTPVSTASTITPDIRFSAGTPRSDPRPDSIFEEVESPEVITKEEFEKGN